ncbi:MAG: hypothetical protein RLY93_01355 [Sumerlaeia bacterium]
MSGKTRGKIVGFGQLFAAFALLIALAAAPHFRKSASDSSPRGKSTANSLAGREELHPPFSLTDCEYLLGLAATEVEGNPEATDKDPRALLTSVRSYLTHRDDIYSTLFHYNWERIGRERVAEGVMDTDEFSFYGEDVPAAVNALSIEIRNADAYLFAMQVWDADNPEQKILDLKFDDDPLLLRHSLPRREVFHLWRPARIGKIGLAYARTEQGSGPDREPKVVVYAGRTERPEHGKSAIFFIEQAENQLSQENEEAARRSIVLAQEAIAKFRQTRRNAN